ncbi:hypothetical protein [Paenibacillus assamensis]|uniref:hypothetical protein n=1 Tax=Paenibacillus assamensis TaxID=311244 RepID=UPI0003FB0AD8|nr:hypothetical protein [Paenibacillus assamensis]
MSLNKRNTIILVLISIGLITSIIILNFNTINQYDNKIISVSEGKVLKNQHVLLSKAEKVVHNPKMFTYSHKFQIDKSLEKKINLPGGDAYSYYVNNKESNIIKGEFIVDTRLDGGAINLIFLQGNKTALVRTPSDSNWYSSVSINYKDKATTIIPLELMWDSTGDEDLTVIPISSNKHYDGSYLAISRFVVLNPNVPYDENSTLSDLEIEESLLNDKKINVYPFPKFYDEKKQELEIQNENGQFFIKSLPHKLSLGAISYNTKIDIVIIDKNGKIEETLRDINIVKGNTTDINLSDSLLTKINDSNNKYYALITNNRNRNILYDMNGINKLNQPFPTSFNLIIEFYKVK